MSPLLANVYLHEVLDRWFGADVKPRLKGRGFLIRYADDAVMVFSSESDARKVMTVLAKRFSRYGLTRHPEKTRLVSFQRPSGGTPGGGNTDSGSFDLLGFNVRLASLAEPSIAASQDDLAAIREAPGAVSSPEADRRPEHLPSRSETVTRRAGCGNPARPDLWGAGRSNPPAYPIPEFTMFLRNRNPAGERGKAHTARFVV